MSTVAASPSGGWNRFWFTPADPSTLGLIRILTGLAVLFIHIGYSFDLQAFFGKDAWLNLDLANEYRRELPIVPPPTEWEHRLPSAAGEDPQKAAQVTQHVQRWGVHPDLAHSHGTPSWSIWYHVTDPTAMAWLHGAILVVMALYTVGFCTRVTSVLAWLAAMQYVHRGLTTLFGMDQMMILLLMYLMLAPSGAAFSVDRWLLRRGWSWGWLFGQQASALPDQPEPSVAANVALRLMQVHMCFIYMAAGLSKLLGSSWWNGTALWWAVANYDFTPLRYGWYADSVRWLSKHRLFWELFMSGGVVFTLVFQISFPFLVWNPKRRWILVAGSVLLHTMISVIMGLLGFGLCMIALALSFVPPEVVRDWAAGLLEPRKKPAVVPPTAEPALMQAA